MARKSRSVPDDDIAIVGMSVNVPGASTLEAFWRNLADGVESIRSLEDADLLAAGETKEKIKRSNYVSSAAVLDGYDMFDPEFFGFSPKEAAILDPQHRKFLEVSWEALENAGHPPENFAGKIGVYAGCGMGSYFYFNICSNPGMVDDTGMFLLRHTGNDKDFLSTRVSHIFDLKGPSINLQTACSTSLVAVHYAAQALKSGECDMAIAGGVTIELPHGRGYLYQENEILSPDGHCHAFDHRAQGTVFGSGAGAVVLRRLSEALADGDHIWAVIKGSAINNDGAAKAGYLAPSVTGQAEAIAEAQKAAGITADTVGYVECHGTGTYLGDPIEVSALTEAFRQTTDATDFCRIGSVKTNIGHLDTAAGVASLAKTALALHHKAIPPSLGYETPNPVIEFDTSPFQVNAALTPWAADAPRRAGVNSLGVGGTNAHVVLEEAPRQASSGESDWPFHVLTISGRSRAALDANTDAIVAHLRARRDQPLADIAYTLKDGRRGFDHRRVVVAGSHTEAADLLEATDPHRVYSHSVVNDAPEVVFMFPGGGAQYPGMARDLYETEPVFRTWMDKGLDHLQPNLDYDIRSIWLAECDALVGAADTLKRPSIQLPLIMITEYALAQLWMSWGVRPAVLVGHSMGENTAACLAGVLALEDCINLVLLRGQLFDSVPPGGMLSVPLSAEDLARYLSDDLGIAALNAPGLTAVSGPQAALNTLQTRLAAEDIEAQRIGIDIAAHSRMLEPILSKFRAFLDGLDLKAPTLPFLSNRTGTYITDQQATDPAYWVDHLRHTVRFADCVETLANEEARVWLEVGPGKALSSLAQMNPKVSGNQVLSSLRHPDQDIPDDIYFVGLIGRLWATGVEADWSQIWGDARRLRVPLPTYQFQRKRYFIEPGQTQSQPAPEPLVRRDDMAQWGYRPVWRKRLADCGIDLEDDAAAGLLQTWLLFSDETGLSAKVAIRLRQIGHRVIEVAQSDTFVRHGPEAYSLAPVQGREGYDALFRDLVADGAAPSRIAHFWLLTGAETYRPGSSFFDRNLECGFYSLFHLAQALAEADSTDAIHMTVVTNGAAQVRAEALHYPEKATIAGPCGVIPKEFPGLTCATVDVETARGKGAASRWPFRASSTEPHADRLVTRLLEDLLSTPANSLAAYRGDDRFEMEYRATGLDASADPTQMGFRHGGTYLITGGLGGIGISVAETLLRDFHANVILVSRQPLPDRAEWTGHVMRHGPADQVSRRIRDVQRLETLSGQVMIAAADVCNPDDLANAVASGRARFGQIDGVLHASGVIDDAPLLGKTKSGIEAVLAPKIQGTRVLDALFPDGSLDLMVLFSSTSTATRPAGQVDYIAANEFLNAYAKSRRGGKTRVVAVNWGVWAEVGMAALAVANDQTDPKTQSEPAGQPLLQTVTHDSDGNRVYTTALSTASNWVLDQHRTAQRDAIMPGTGYLELAAEALAAQGKQAPFSIEDLHFLRPLGVGDTESRDIKVRLRPTNEGCSFEVLSACTVDSRSGFQLNAKGMLVTEKPHGGAAPIDLQALTKRTDIRVEDVGSLKSPQEAHLNFGPRWQVLKSMRFGTGEGLAHLSLPLAVRGDLHDGYLLHPALLDLATGWAMELIPGYSSDCLWVPAAYRRVSVLSQLPAEIFSWVRVAKGSVGDRFADFDVTICDKTGKVVVEIEGFTMSRLEASDGFARNAAIDPKGVEFDKNAGAARSLTAAEERLAYLVSQGIRPNEGPEALLRAISTGQSHIVVSSLDLLALIRQADSNTSSTPAPEQTFDRPDVDTDFVAPATEVESTLATFWQELLGLSKVGVNDSFFDLGGHSLIAVRLFSKIRKAFAVDFPLSVLFEAPTIATCAAMIAKRTGHHDAAAAPASVDRPKYEHLVAMHEGKGGLGTPMFMVAGMFGNVLNLRHLAQQTSADRPFYGLQARGLLGEVAPHETIPSASRDYIAEIKLVQPEGPYLLGGFSGGGITAYEMAHQLRAAGEEVAMLVMLDTPLPVRPPLTSRDKALIKIQEIRRKGPIYLGKWARDRIRWELKKRSHAASSSGPNHADQFHDRDIEAAFRAAVATYDLQPWSGPLTLLRPPLDRHWQVSNGRWVSREREYVFDDNDWTGLAPQIDVQEVPGDHDSMVLEPNVRVLAQRLKACLGAAGRQSDQQETTTWLPATAAE